ncbi:nuclease EXOG, mitochondrial-like [Ptychodera flava]|uniref:nuclease EXOG, mitochondrial-like n=1 Tax=Ptychodera flava TaxID=63121 RepID=UPI00396A9806
MQAVGRLLGGSGMLVGTTVTSFLIGYLVHPVTKEATQSTRFEHPVFDPQKVARGEQILKYGAPDRGPELRYYANHVLSYDQAKKTPLWVAEHITKDHLNGSASRKDSKFRRDPSIPDFYSSYNSDYVGSGYSRGHMAPAGDNKYSQLAMNETFYLSNILPQDINNNMVFWNRVEIYCRGLTEKFTDVYIISGPLVIPQQDKDGNKYVKYQVIGNSNVAVPTHLFKIIAAENATQGQQVAVGAFVIPNEPISSDRQLIEFQVNLEDVEKFSGFTFLKKLNRTEAKNLCDVDGCKLIPTDELELLTVGKKLAGAKSTNALNKVWNDMNEKGLKPDQYLQDVFNKRKKELQEKEEKGTK